MVAVNHGTSLERTACAATGLTGSSVSGMEWRRWETPHPLCSLGLQQSNTPPHAVQDAEGPAQRPALSRPSWAPSCRLLVSRICPFRRCASRGGVASVLQGSRASATTPVTGCLLPVPALRESISYTPHLSAGRTSAEPPGAQGSGQTAWSHTSRGSTWKHVL